MHTKRTRRRRDWLQVLVGLATMLALVPVNSGVALADHVDEDGPEPGEVRQVAVLDDSVHDYLSSDKSGTEGIGSGVEDDAPPGLQPASMTATFSDFSLNGISFVDWITCRGEDNDGDGSPNTVHECLEALIGDRDGDGDVDIHDIHPGEIGGDILEFDVTIKNTSSDAVLTNFFFQAKFSESPALSSRIGDKLFSAVRVDYNGPTNGLIGVKKNGTSNGLYNGKIKGICINSSTDYPSDLNAGTQFETLECAGGRAFDRDPDVQAPYLADENDDEITLENLVLPKGLKPGDSQTIRIRLDTSTDDGALQRQHAPETTDDPDTPEREHLLLGPLTGTVVECTQTRIDAGDCPQSHLGQPLLVEAGTVVGLVDFGDVKILRNADGEFQPSFATTCEGTGEDRRCFFARQDQNLTMPRRNWGFTDILDTRDDYQADGDGDILSTLNDPANDPDCSDTDADGSLECVFSFLDVGDLEADMLNFASILFGFGEHGDTLDPSCAPGGSQAGKCGGAPYVPFGEFYVVTDYDGDGNDELVRQEVTGFYEGGSYDGTNAPFITATVTTDDGDPADGDMTDTTLPWKATNFFAPEGTLNPGNALGGSAKVEFSDFVTISDDLGTFQNEGGVAGGDRFRFTMTITNTSAEGSGIHLYNFGFQTKERALTDLHPFLDGFAIEDRQDLRADSSNEACPDSDSDGIPDLEAVDCWDEHLGIGHYPNVIGNALLSATFAEPDALDPLFGTPDQGVSGKLEAIKKNGPFQPLTDGNRNYICIKAGDPVEDQDAIETCDGDPTNDDGTQSGLAPGESQTVRLELDYGDFRGLILEVAAGTLFPPEEDPDGDGENDFDLIGDRGDFDCRDQRRLPYCHPDLANSTDPAVKQWFTDPETLEEVIYVTVHQRGDAATVMSYEENFGQILAIGGFLPIAEFSRVIDGTLHTEGVAGEYGGSTFGVDLTSPEDGDTLSGTVEVSAVTSGSETADSVTFFYDYQDDNETVLVEIGKDTEGSDGWSVSWDTSTVDDGGYTLIAEATSTTGKVADDSIAVTVQNALGVTFINPADGDVLTGTVTLAAETTGLDPANSVTFSYDYLDDSQDVVVEIGEATDTDGDGSWELDWDTTTLPEGDGNYQLIVEAANADSETATDAITIEVVSLGVTIVAPDAGAILAGEVELQAEVISAEPLDPAEDDTVVFSYDAHDDPPVEIGEAIFDAERGLWVLLWDTRSVSDTHMEIDGGDVFYTKPPTLDGLSVVATDIEEGDVHDTATDAIEVRIRNMLTPRIFLPDNQETLVGYQDLEALVSSEFAVSTVRFDVYHIDNIHPDIRKSFGELSTTGDPIPNPHFSTPNHNPGWPMGDPLYEIGAAIQEGAQRWVFRNWDTVNVPDGTYGLVVTATDGGGRTSTYSVETFIVNNLDVMMSSPAEGANVGPFVALEAFTKGLFSVTDVVFSVGGTDIVAEEASPGRWKATWDATGFDDGPYTVLVTATNTAGDVAKDSVDVIMDKGTNDPLEAFFAFDWSNCITTTCSFLDGSRGGPTSWTWDFGDGNTSDDQNPSHTYAGPGVYTVTLTVDDDDPDTAPSDYIRVIPVGNIGLVELNNQAINNDGTETITWTSSWKDFGYEVGDSIWVPAMWRATTGPTQFDELPDNVLFTPEEADGEGPRNIQAADDGVLFEMVFTEVQFKGETEVFKGKVNVRPEVLVDSDRDGTLDWETKLGTNIDVTNTDLVEEGDFLYVWITDPDEGDEVAGMVPITATPLANVTVDEVEFFVDGTSIGTDGDGSDGFSVDWDASGLSGDRTLTAAARGSGLTASSSPVTVTVVDSVTNQAPTAAIKEPVTCVDLTCTFDGSGSSDPDGDIVSYEWNFGDGNTATGETTRHIYADPDTYTVTLTVTDDDGATNTATATVTVTAPDDGGDDGGSDENQAPTAAFDHSCLALTCDFDGSGSSDPDGTIVSYDWDFGDGTTGTGETTSHSYAAAGTYTVTLTVTDDEGATGTTSQDITVTEVLVESCTDFVCDFDASETPHPSGNPIVSYEWTFEELNPDGSVRATTFSSGAKVSRLFPSEDISEAEWTDVDGFNGSMDVRVTLTVTDTEGVSDSTEMLATVTNDNTTENGDVANIFPNGRNTALNGVQEVLWTSAHTDGDYTVGESILVYLRWSMDRGATDSVRLEGSGLGTDGDCDPNAVRLRDDNAFDPGDADGTEPVVIDCGRDWMLFEMTITKVHQPGRKPEGKANAHLLATIQVDEDGDGILDGTADLGINVHVLTNAN